MNGQQIADGGRGWAHVQCFIADRRERVTTINVEYSYGEVGHDPPVHAVAGSWQGPDITSRAEAVNISLCGKRLSRVRKRQPDVHDLCRRCEQLMTDIPRTPLAALTVTSEPTSAQEYEVLTVGLGQLFVDRTPGLQRPEQVNWTKRIAASFSWARFYENPPKVSARGDGRYHVMDGQHEVAAARLAGHDPFTAIRVHVWRNLSSQQEAELFGHTNRDRHAVRALDLFIADVTSGHSDAAALDILLNSYEWKAGSAGREGNFAAVTTLRRLYGKPGGPELCEKVVATITRAWDHSPDGANRTVVTALGAFYEQYPAADVDRLAQVLKRGMTPASMHVWAHEPSWKKIAVVRLQERYDNGLRDPKRRLVQPTP